MLTLVDAFLFASANVRQTVSSKNNLTYIGANKNGFAPPPALVVTRRILSALAPKLVSIRRFPLSNAMARLLKTFCASMVFVTDVRLDPDPVVTRDKRSRSNGATAESWSELLDTVAAMCERVLTLSVASEAPAVLQPDIRGDIAPEHQMPRLASFGKFPWLELLELPLRIFPGSVLKFVAPVSKRLRRVDLCAAHELNSMRMADLVVDWRAIALLAPAAETVTELRLAPLSFGFADDFRFFFDDFLCKFRNLERLEICIASLHFALRDEFGTARFQRLFSSLRKLRSFCTPYALDTQADWLQPGMLRAIAECATELTRLELRAPGDTMTALPGGDDGDDAVACEFYKLSELRVLTLTGMGGMLGDDAVCAWASLRHLCELRLPDQTGVSNAGLRALLRGIGAGQLTVLDLSGNPNVNNETIALLREFAGASLRELRVSRCDEVDDAGMKLLLPVAIFPRLRLVVGELMCAVCQAPAWFSQGARVGRFDGATVVTSGDAEDDD